MPLSVQLSAMSKSSYRTISGFIKTKGKTHFKLCEQQAPEVIILDIDTAEGKNLLLQYQYNDTQVIALSLSTQIESSSSVVHIQKPITGIELIRAAERISASEKVKTIDKVKTVDKINEEQFYEPSQTLQGMLRRAIQLSDKENTVVALYIQKYIIEIDANKKRAYLNFSQRRLRNLCYLPMNTSNCRIKKKSIISSLPEGCSLPLPELSWNTALLCSRGRIAHTLSDDHIFQLKAWPNLTRWNVPKNALKISSLWSKSPNSITPIAQQLSIPISDVRSFITAALDSNLAIICQQNSKIIPFEAKNKNSTLFKKLLNRLNRA